MWKHQYFENNTKELHTNIFRSLEIEQYIKKTLKNYGFSIENYQINFSNETINILLSVCKLKQISSKTEKNKIIKKIYKYKKKYLNDLPLKKKYLNTLNLYKISRLQTKIQTFKKLDSNNLADKILKSLKLFTKNKQNIYLTIKEINFVNSNEVAQQILKTLYKFRKTSFYKEGEKILTPFITQQNSAKLLGNFIASQLKVVKKQHNFFFNFLKESLEILLNQKFSIIQGIKIVIKGRINNAARSQTRILKLGKISLICMNSKIDYAESTAFTSNGTIGIKVWIAKK